MVPAPDSTLVRRPGPSPEGPQSNRAITAGIAWFVASWWTGRWCRGREPVAAASACSGRGFGLAVAVQLVGSGSQPSMA